MRFRALVGVVVVALVEGAAAAQPVQLAAPPLVGWSLAAEAELGRAQVGGGLAHDLEPAEGGWHAWAVTASVRGVSLTADFGVTDLDSKVPERDSARLGLTARGYHLGYRVPLSRRIHLVPRVGLRRLDLEGSGRVFRTCSQTGDCDGGFYHEVPRYADRAPVLGLRLEFLAAPPRAEAGLVGIAALGLSWTPVEIEVPADGPRRGHLVLVTIGASLGYGR